jgi:hypothetical protein
MGKYITPIAMLDKCLVKNGVDDKWTLPQSVYKVKQLYLNNIH